MALRNSARKSRRRLKRALADGSKKAEAGVIDQHFIDAAKFQMGFADHPRYFVPAGEIQGKTLRLASGSFDFPADFTPEAVRGEPQESEPLLPELMPEP